MRSLETWTRQRASRWIAAATTLVGCWLLVATSGRPLREASFDTTFSLLGASTSPPADCPVVIVYLDLDAYLSRGLDPKQPWPVELHAQLLDRLTRAGARAVAFDIVFDKADPNSTAHQVLRDAIQRNRHVFLAAETAGSSHGLDPSHSAWAQAARLVLPDEFYRSVAAGWGLADLQPDQDFIIRRQYTGWPQQEVERPSLSHAVQNHLDAGPPRTTTGRRAPQAWMRFYGPPLTIPHVSINQALENDVVMDGFFRDRVVFIGAYPMSGKFPDRRDEFRGPYHNWRSASVFMPGVEFHATQMLNLMQGNPLHQLHPLLELTGVAAIGLGLGLGLVRLRPRGALLAGLGAAGSFALMEWGLFRGLNVWWSWLIPAAVQVPLALGGTVLVHWMDWFRARRRMEAAKRADDARIREQAALIEKAHDAIFVQELDGSFRYANPSAERLFGWTRQEFVEGRAQALFETEPAHAAAGIARQRGEWTGELRLLTRQGRELRLESRWNIIPAEQGRPASVMIIGNDVTERRLLEAQALRAQRMEAIGALAGGMAHDLNNALAPVLLGAQLLRRELDSASATRLLDLIESGASRGAGMVKQVLLFARGRQGHMGPVDLRTLAEEMAKLARDTFPRSVHVSTQFADSDWLIHGNPTELHQVLLNFCVNARDAMPEGGSLCIAVDTVELDTTEAERFPGAAPGSYVSLMVSDTGSGIPAEHLPKIFDAFFTTKPEGVGTGLGLSTSARIVRSHQGFIGVTSVVGEGTTFEVLFPRFIEPPDTQPTIAPQLPPTARGHRILIADDDATSLQLVQRHLEERGFNVEIASDGAGVSRKIEQFRETPTEITLIICNDSMPLLDGSSALDALRTAFKNQPLILLTRASDSISSGTINPSGVTTIHKPYEWELLLETIHQLLHLESPPTSKQ